MCLSGVPLPSGVCQALAERVESWPRLVLHLNPAQSVFEESLVLVPKVDPPRTELRVLPDHRFEVRTRWDFDFRLRELSGRGGVGVGGVVGVVLLG